MESKYITEEAWSKILPFLRKSEKVYTSDSRCFLEAVFWVVRTDAQWQMLPETYGNWNSIYQGFNRWSKNGVFQDLLEFCAHDADLEYLSIDSTIARTHSCAAGYGDQAVQGLGRSKGEFNSKIHATVDALGNPLRFIITPG